MTTYRRGDVVFVPFEFTDRDKRKNRPAVVISSDDYNRSRDDLIIAGITSNIGRSGFVGQLSIADWTECGLEKPSVISGIIQTVRETKIGHRIGTLTRQDQKSLDSTLVVIFGFRRRQPERY
jgi:mRNA-degrading endonuclease toxin of MazEF toxin-antitoxin module